MLATSTPKCHTLVPAPTPGTVFQIVTRVAEWIPSPVLIDLIMTCSRRLYAFSLPDPIPFEDYDALLTLLSPAEQARVQRYRLPEDRLRSLISRLGVWYHLLSTGLLNEGHPAPVFKAASRGKPYLVTPLTRNGRGVQIGFNASHEGGWVLLGVSEQVQGNDGAVAKVGPPTTRGPPSTEVGVDVMVPPQDPFDLKEALIPQMTTPERLSLSVPLTPSRLRWTLTALWALKEGYTKAVGDGVGFGLERIHVEFGSPTGAAGAADAVAGSAAPQAINDSLPILGVRVDGRDVRDDGWAYAAGSVGEGMGQVGYATYWRQEAGGDDRGARVEVEVVRWEDVVLAFDKVPSHEKRARVGDGV